MNIEIKISKKPVNYNYAIEQLEYRVKKIINSQEKNLLWILEHPNLYTGGTSAKKKDLLDLKKFPTYKSSRGGQWTFHGEGQKIVYFALVLKNKNIKEFVRSIELFIMDILKDYGIKSFNDKKNIGIWVKNNKGKIGKIAAIGIRVKNGWLFTVFR